MNIADTNIADELERRGYTQTRPGVFTNMRRELEKRGFTQPRPGVFIKREKTGDDFSHVRICRDERTVCINGTGAGHRQACQERVALEQLCRVTPRSSRPDAAPIR